MKKTQIKFLAVVATSLIAASASAAEACKPYVKLDLGYGVSSATRLKGDIFVPGTPATKSSYESQLYKNQRGMIGAAGVGYAFNDAMRAEVSFDFRPKMKSHSNVFAVETRELGGSAKVAYDFNNTTPVTPFVFASMGASNVRPKLKPYASPGVLTSSEPGYLTFASIKDNGEYVKDSNGNILTHQSVSVKSKTVVTYGGGFGLSLKGSEGINIDLTYGIGGKGNYAVASNLATLRVASSSTPSAGNVTEASIKNQALIHQLKFKNQMEQSLTLGVRFTM